MDDGNDEVWGLNDGEEVAWELNEAWEPGDGNDEALELGGSEFTQDGHTNFWEPEQRSSSTQIVWYHWQQFEQQIHYESLIVWK